MTDACEIRKRNLLPQFKFESCIDKEASRVDVSNEVANYTRHAELDEVEHAAVTALSAADQKNFFVQKLKNRLAARVGEKYLIQVATNIPNQSCGLTGEYQSNDTFFQSIANQFPIQNYKVSSICSKDGTSSESIRKLASDFISVVNSEYALGLLPNERVTSVKLKLKDKSDIFDLSFGQDYEIVNGQFKLLNANLLKFEKIDIEIKSN